MHADYGSTAEIGVFGEYSNDSSHILIGQARNRKLLDFGVEYSRQIIQVSEISLQYLGDLRPIMLESDPITDQVNKYVSPSPGVTYTNDAPEVAACHPYMQTITTVVQSVTYIDDFTQTCPSRRWTYGAGVAPLGFKANLLRGRRIQPVITGLAGLIFSTRSIPITTASSWNFTSQVGAGVEVYSSASHSIRFEWYYHHISNADTAQQNPGIDNGLLQVTYSFGR